VHQNGGERPSNALPRALFTSSSPAIRGVGSLVHLLKSAPRAVKPRSEGYHHHPGAPARRIAGAGTDLGLTGSLDGTA
jgi:hypothetical protein